MVFRYLFDNEFLQRMDIDRLEESLRTQSRSRHRQSLRQAKATKERFVELEKQIGELALVCRALLTYLRETGGIDPGKFAAVMERIDAEDGVHDGRVTPESLRPEALTDEPQPAPKPRRRRR